MQIHYQNIYCDLRQPSCIIFLWKRHYYISNVWLLKVLSTRNIPENWSKTRHVFVRHLARLKFEKWNKFWSKIVECSYSDHTQLQLTYSTLSNWDFLLLKCSSLVVFPYQSSKNLEKNIFRKKTVILPIWHIEIL